jgi:hypothetical protein
MKIGLLTDSKMINLPLMKLSAYHKKDQVEWFTNSFIQDDLDILYVSKVFEFSKLSQLAYYKGKQIIIGGTGYDYKFKNKKLIKLNNTFLDPKIENSQPDYSIYPNCDYSIQMFSRGCIRNCSFCIVPQKEGKIYPVDPINLNPKGNRIEIFDNNFFANPLWKSAIKLIKRWNQPINFHGIDLRILTEEQAKILSELKYLEGIHVGWDNPNEDLTKKFNLLFKYIKPYRITCYILIGYHSTEQQDLYRIKKLKEMKVVPFAMPFDKDNKYQNNFARWVNGFIYKNVEWKDYIKK